MSEEEFVEVIRGAVRRVDLSLEVERLEMESSLEDFGITSVTMMEVVGVLEDDLGLRFADDDLVVLRTPRDLFALIHGAS
ncbi:MAG: acyl carrier protein [Myxococcota bacterium]|nr:acyl carrier protein [Myxococcota bacterium]